MLGLNIVVSHVIERPLIGHNIRPIFAHWFIRPVLRFFKISDFIAWLPTPMIGHPPIIQQGNTVFVHPETYAALKADPSIITI